MPSGASRKHLGVMCALPGHPRRASALSGPRRGHAPRHLAHSGGATTVRARLDRILFGLACFAVPVGLLVVACAWNGIYPFGERSFLGEDLAYQYFDFYQWFIRVLQGKASLLYNPYTGLGTNAWGIYSYYLGSPLNLLLPLFGPDHITLFVYVTTAIKLGCAGEAMAWYLRRRFGLLRPTALILCACYAWSSWSQTEMCNPQWLDALVMLPVLAWCVRLIVADGRWLPLAAAVGYVTVCCWYAAYMSLAYLVVLLALELVAGSKGDATLAQLVRRAGLCALAVCLGLCLAAFSFVPSVAQMVLTNAHSGTKLPDLVGLPQVLRGMALAGFERDTTPQLFASTLVIVSCAGFCARRSIDVRLRLAGLGALGFLLLCTSVPQLQQAWTGFRTATGFYCRMSWVIVFTCIWLAAIYLRELERDGAGAELVTGPLAVAAIACVAYTGTTYELADAVRMVAAGVLCAGLLLAGARLDRRLIVWPLMLALAAAELTYGAHRSLPYRYGEEYGVCDEADNQAYYHEATERLDELTALDPGIYRYDKTRTRTGLAALNEGMALGYLAVSSYCSSQNGNAIALLSHLGMSVEGEFFLSHTQPNLTLDALLGVRYLTANVGRVGYEDTGLPATAGRLVDGEPASSAAHTYRNPYALSLAFGVSEAAVGATTLGVDDAFAEQNALFSKLLGTDVELYVSLEATPTTQVPESAEARLQETSDYYAWEVEVPEGMVAFARTRRFQKSTRLFAGHRSYAQNSQWHHGCVELADARTKVREVNVAVFGDPGWVLRDTASQDEVALFYGLDWEVFERVMDKLAEHQAEVTRFDAGHIELDYASEEDGWLMLTVPAEPGWTCTVGGESVQTAAAFDDAFIVVPVKAGANHVELRFCPPGLVAGCVVTTVSAAICAWLWQRRIPRPAT